MSDTERDWLHRFTAREWLAAALNELERAERAQGQRDRAATAAGLKRAAGMALNGALRVAPRPSWGRTYVEHLRALAEGDGDEVPGDVIDAARCLVALAPPSGSVVSLSTRTRDVELLEAGRTVMAYAWAIVTRSEVP